MAGTEKADRSDRSISADRSERRDRASDVRDALSDTAREALSEKTVKAQDTLEKPTDLQAAQDRLAAHGQDAKQRVEQQINDMPPANQASMASAIVGTSVVAPLAADAAAVGAAIRAATPAGALVATAIGAERINDIATNRRVVRAAETLGLSTATVEGALAAEAYSSVKEIATTGFLPGVAKGAGPDAQVAAEAVALTELAHPGTYRRAGTDPAAQQMVNNAITGAVAALEASKLTPVDGTWSQGWAETFPALTPGEQKLGELPGFTAVQVEAFQEAYTPEVLGLPNHTGHPAPTIEGIDIISTPIPDMEQALILENRRYEPGTVSGQGQIIEGDWLRGHIAAGTGAPIPAQIADKLSGQEFATFDKFREAFWKEVAADPDLAGQFAPQSLSRMRNGRAPISPPPEQVGKRRSLEIDHIEAIFRGGDVYSVDNLQVMTPRAHIEKTKDD